MRFMMGTDRVKVIKTVNKEYPYVVYINKNSLSFRIVNAIPFLGLLLLLCYLINMHTRKQQEGEVIFDSQITENVTK